MNSRSNARTHSPKFVTTDQHNANVSNFMETDPVPQEEGQKPHGQALSQKLTEPMIKTLTNTENLTNLTELCLNSKMIQMPWRIRQLGGLNNLMNLRELDLSNNEIERIENLGALKQLRVLKLNANRIKKLENISVLKSLEVLDLSQNLIEDIPALISLNKLLSSLNLSYNIIQKKELILNLRACVKLRELFFIGNPFAQLPEYVVYVQSSLRQLKALDGEIFASNSAYRKGVSSNPGSNNGDLKRTRNTKNSEVKYDDSCEIEGFEELTCRSYYANANSNSLSNGGGQLSERRGIFDFKKSMNLSALELNKDIMTDEQFSGRYIQLSEREIQFEARSNASSTTQLSSARNNQGKDLENNPVVSPRDSFQQQKQVTSLQSFQSLKKVLESKNLRSSKEITTKQQHMRTENSQHSRNDLSITCSSTNRNDREETIKKSKDEISSRDMTIVLAQYKESADENSKAYYALIKDIEQMKEECLTLLKQINASLEGHINEGESNEYESDGTRLVLLNEYPLILHSHYHTGTNRRSEMISRIREFLCLLDSENEYQMNYFLLALKTRCEKAESTLKKVLNNSITMHDQHESQEFENEEQVFESMIKSLSDNYMELEKLSVKLLNIRENLSARILKGFTHENKYFSTLITKLSELQEKERLRMGLFSELNDKYHKIYDVIQRIQLSHQKGLQIDGDIDSKTLGKLVKQNGVNERDSDTRRRGIGSSRNLLSTSLTKDQPLLCAQNPISSAKSRYQELKRTSLDTEATAKSQELKKEDEEDNDEEKLSEEMEEEQYSANWGSQNPDNNSSYNEYYSGNAASCQSEEFLPGTLQPQNKPISNSLTENLLPKQESRTQQERPAATAQIPEVKPNFSSFSKSTNIAESTKCQDRPPSECTSCKQKDNEIAALTAKVEKANTENNHLSTNMHELCQTLDELRESFEQALKEQAESYETRLNQHTNQNEQLLQHINHLLEESHSSSEKINELKCSLDNMYAAFSQSISSSNEIQTDLPWILKTQSMVIESLIAQRASLENQYRGSLQLYKDYVENSNNVSRNDPQKVDLIISDFFNSAQHDHSLTTNENLKKSSIPHAEEAHENLVFPIHNSNLIAHDANSNSHDISPRRAENKEREDRQTYFQSNESFAQKVKQTTQMGGRSTPKIKNQKYELVETNIDQDSSRYEENQGNQKIGGANNRTILNHIVSALPQPRVATIHRRLEEAEIDQKRRQENINRLSFADKQLFTQNTNQFLEAHNKVVTSEANQKNTSKTLDLSRSRNSPSPSNSRSLSPSTRMPLAPANNLMNQNEQLSTSSPNLSKALFGTKSAEKENKDAANDTANSFLLKEIPDLAFNNENISPAKLNNSTSAPVIFNRITGNVPGILSNLNENIAQTIYQKTPTKPQAGLINLHMNVLHYRDFKGKQNQGKPRFIQKKDPSQNLNTSRVAGKDERTPKRVRNQLLVPQLSAQSLLSSRSQKLLTGHNSVTNLQNSNRANVTQITQPTHTPIDHNQVFRKNSRYTAECTREISVNLQSFLDHKRRMFDTPDIANYSDRFDITSPYHPLYTQSMLDQSRNSANLSFKQAGLTSRSISREGTNRVSSPADERMNSSFQSSRLESRANLKGKSRILSTILGTKKARANNQ